MNETRLAQAETNVALAAGKISPSLASVEPQRPSPVAAEAADGWELVRLAQRAVRLARWGAGIGAVLLCGVVLAEALRFYDLFARIHWSVGYGYLATLAAVLVVGVGVPAWRYWRLPVVLKPPDVHLDDGRLDGDHLAKRARFVARYCAAIARNPELADRHATIDRAGNAAADIARRAKDADPRLVPHLTAELLRVEREQVEPILNGLDRRVDGYIRKEAVAVGIATAVSMNGMLDAFIVFWRNANMISRIARFYYGRVGLRGSLRILADVAGIVVLSRAMDDLSDMAGECAGRALGSLAGVLVGPVVDGSVNALMTMKVGHLAKRRCRSFEAWNEKVRRGVLADVMRRVASESAGVVKDVVRRVGILPRHTAAAARAAAGSVANGGRHAWNYVRTVLGSRRRPAV